MSINRKKAFGYRQIPNAAFETDQITAEGYRTLAAVQFYDRMGNNGRGCDASVATIAAKAFCDIRTAQRWLSRLTKMGLLSANKRFGRGVTHIYTVVYDSDQKDDTDDALSGGKRVTAGTEKGDSSFSELKLDQLLTPPNDTLRDTNAKLAMIHSDQSARFPDKPTAKEDTKGYVAYLSRMDRIGRKSGLPRDRVEDVLDIAEALMTLFENGTPEYGIACRIISSYYLVHEEAADEQSA